MTAGRTSYERRVNFGAVRDNWVKGIICRKLNCVGCFLRQTRTFGKDKEGVENFKKGFICGDRCEFAEVADGLKAIRTKHPEAFDAMCVDRIGAKGLADVLAAIDKGLPALDFAEMLHYLPETGTNDGGYHCQRTR